MTRVRRRFIIDGIGEAPVMDVFAEVKRIEDEAERLLSEARASAESSVAKAREDAEARRARAERQIEDERARLKAEQQRKIAEDVAAVEADFRGRKARLDETAREVDALAGLVVDRLLKDSV